MHVSINTPQHTCHLQPLLQTLRLGQLLLMLVQNHHQRLMLPMLLLLQLLRRYPQRRLPLHLQLPQLA
jgi:hypothetical protein